MRRRRLARRVLSVLVVSGAVAGVLTAVSAAPAAAESITLVDRSSWAYIDVREPRTTFTTGDAPVGAWRDDGGGYHSSKSYFSFDLTQFRGTRILGAELFIAERAANDCTKPRVTELWLTDPADRPTWIRQPRERATLPGPGAQQGCLSGRVEWDAAAAIRDTLAAGGTRMTLALRLPDQHQFDPAYGRHYANLMRITIDYNRPPATPTDLGVGITPCVPEIFVPIHNPVLQARFDDPDDGLLTGTFAIWPVDDPTRRTERTATAVSGGYATASVPDGVVVDGATYEWAVRASDDTDTSDWSPPCRFTADLVRPAVGPTVSSMDYPEDSGPPGSGGPGIPGRFTFTANGVADVAGFDYGAFEPHQFVRADVLGGGVTIEYAPPSDGPWDLAVRSVDRAGNRSPTVHYRFWVRTTAPEITTDTEARLGFPKQFHFAPRMDDVVEYTYQFNDGPETVVPAGPDGTADVTLLLNRPAHNELRVWSRTRDGVRSGTSNYFLYIDPAAPLVSHTPENGLVGTPFEFTFRPVLPGVVEYTYRLNHELPVTVPAAEDGTLTVTLTPDRGDWNTLYVSSTNRDGIRSGEANYAFLVDSGAPTVASEQYPPNQYSGGVGVPGDFTFISRLPNVVEYVYTFNFGDEQVVPAAPDGSATITITPDRPYWQYLLVRSRSSDGTLSAETWYSFAVNESP